MDAVLNWLWQGCLLTAASCAMLRVLERARANVRYAVWWAALLFILVLPALPSLTSATPSAAAFDSARGDAMVLLPDAWWTSTIMMLTMWMAWASVCALRFISAMAALRRARKRSRAFPSGVESMLPHWSRIRFAGRRATLVLSDSVTTASVLGWGPPMIAVAPSLVKTLDAGQLDRVLIHEWAHVQRRDDFGHILQIALRTVAGWHPAVWWIDRRLHVEREIACDEMTVAITGSPKSYAECLIELASLRGTAQTMRAAPAVFAAPGLRARITKVLSPDPRLAPLWSRTMAVAIVSTLAMMSISVGGLKLVAGTAFAQSFESTSRRLISGAMDPIAPVAAPTRSAPAEKHLSPRQTAVSRPSAQRPKAKDPSPSPPPSKASEPDARQTPATIDGVETTTSGEEGNGDRTVTSETSTVLQPSEKQPTEETADQPRAPWSALADGGTALGRKSKEAGVATGGFFTRLGRRVAGSF